MIFQLASPGMLHCQCQQVCFNGLSGSWLHVLMRSFQEIVCPVGIILASQVWYRQDATSLSQGAFCS